MIVVNCAREQREVLRLRYGSVIDCSISKSAQRRMKILTGIKFFCKILVQLK